MVRDTSQLAAHTDLTAFRVVAVALYASLLLAWVTVAVRTFRQSRHGSLLTPPPASVRPAAQKG